MSSAATRAVSWRGSLGRHRQQEQILEQRDRIDVGLGHRQRQHRGVERAALDVLDQLPGLGLAQLQPQFRKSALQQRAESAAADRAPATE